MRSPIKRELISGGSTLDRSVIAIALRVSVLLLVVGLAGPSFGQWTEQVLKAFDSTGSSGNMPRGPLIQGIDGALYGLTSAGGASFGQGTVFEINCDGSGFNVLYTFHGGANGASPEGGLLQGKDGALYGTTSSSGAFGVGTIFKLSPDGRGFVTLRSF